MPRSVASTRACGLISWAAKMPRTGDEQRVAVEQLEVAGQLLDPVDLAASLDLDGDRRAVGVAAHQVDRADRGRELAAYERQAVGQRRGVLGEQLLEVLLDAVLLQPGIDAEVVAGVVQDLLDQDAQAVAGLGLDQPLDLAVLGVTLLDRCTAGSSSSAACRSRRRSAPAPTRRT